MLIAPYTTQYLTQHFADDDFTTLAGYERKGGYRAARKALTELAPADLIQLVKDAGLQGRGGAGFSTGLKWSFMPTGGAQPKYLVCDADESEPGSFKDRILIERGSHQMLEGILIAAWATGAEKTFIYIRGEYAAPLRSSSAASTRPTTRGTSARTRWAPASATTSCSSAAPARTSAARRPGCSSRSRARRA